MALKTIHVSDVFGEYLQTADDDLAQVYRKSEADRYIAETKAENERLSNALDKERSETIKYMDELCNAKNEIERLTIDKRNIELRADVADANIKKLKVENERLKSYIKCVLYRGYITEDAAVATGRELLEEYK